MYIVRWLMGHPILATWFVGAIAILLSIGNHGAKEDVHVDDHANKQQQVETTHTTKTLETPSAVTSALIESDKKKVVVEEIVEVETEVAASTQTENTKSTQTEKQSSVVDNKTAPVSEEIVKKATIDSTTVTSRSYPDGLVVGGYSSSSTKKKIAEAEATEAEAPQAVIETTAGKTGTQADVAVAATEAASTIEETPKPEEATADAKSIEDLGQSSTEEMLLMAREAYWNNGLEEASQIYSQLIELEPNVIEYRGELGNVYWRQGYPKKAAQLYSEIAIPMIEQGNAERVANMIGFIGLFYPDRAAEIHKKLQAVKQ
ncbi:hypothetical protein OO007_01920 [Cocleimonas sp. KMM 6892]|uniref:tetratricopeptide repeat protein n=1 Tax=unclassified Cocleimonas TaxID=2639732 RepID=UPI002DB9312B|nr:MULTISPECIES: hypothetical protein [unclassified Cocleimonas]MEB8430966.1 hypothetical protein [Cocleimonas sp. KMM 6892]MEC4714262.1 hypothetical protein [Cocleimonas sp. KMM 6895]MEC4743593.1 hypothetical protein [Cocleimonas sp. KMM 6896]